MLLGDLPDFGGAGGGHPPVAAASPFGADCLAGLRALPKTMPCKWLYDAEGSRLFELICRSPDYYVARVESALLDQAAPELAALLRPEVALIEFGSGASRKTRILLDALAAVTSYVPIDISAAALARATDAIRRAYPRLRLCPIKGDFAAGLSLPPALLFSDRLGFFPGSTLGNFEPDEAVGFLARVRDLLCGGGMLLLGVDLVKDAATLEAAYDDREGLTAAFNRNLLARANRELGATFDLDRFTHRARWNPALSRVEMHLVSQTAQHVTVAGERVAFTAGEMIHTESSYKYTEASLAQLTERAGWQVERRWIDADCPYAVMLARC